MTAIVITGAPGIGKTTLLPLLADSLDGKGAFLDEDDVGCTRPSSLAMDRLDLIQDNICSCADNFAAWGARWFAAAYVFPSQERMDRIVTKLKEAGHHVLAIGLTADDGVLVERHRNRPEDYGTDPEYLRGTVLWNAGVRGLRGVNLVDTTRLLPEEVAAAIVDYCKSVERGARSE